MPKLVTLKRQLIFAAALLCTLAPVAHAQREAPANISGRVSDDERGVPGVTVMLLLNDSTQRFRAVARAKTDADGRFLLTNVAPGRYQIMPVAPTYVVADLANRFPPGRPININAGEEIKDIDFRVEAGGVITGRITDADGNPVIAEQVMVMPAEMSPEQPRLNLDPREQMTDDRGIYRIYGLPPGRYRVSVGRAGNAGAVSYGRRKLFRVTFYPNTTEQTQARIVEVKSGFETTDIDIAVGRPLKTYRVSGRFVTADTNQPVANMTVSYSIVDVRGRRVSGGGGGGTVTSERGEFFTDGLAPGRYAVYAADSFQSQPESAEFYSEPTIFEVTDSDVSGVVVKLKRGATVSGVVTIEGVSDPASAARMLSTVRVYSFIEIDRRQQPASAGGGRAVNVNPDGTFRVTGLIPGKLRLNTMNDTVRGLTTMRVELNGSSIASGFDLAEGAQVTGVRIVMAHGTGSIVGQTNFLNGTPPPNARIMAIARSAGSMPSNTFTRAAEVDARGFFRIEGVPPGEYEVSVNVIVMGGGAPARPVRSEPVRVHLGEGTETKVTPVINFQPQTEPRKEP